MMRGLSVAAWLLAMAVVLPNNKISFVGANHADIEVDEVFEGEFEDQLVMLADSPTDLQFSPDGKYLFLTQKEGKVFYTTIEDLDNGDAVPKQVFDVNVNHDLCFNGSRGLSSIGVHPEFPSKPWIYLFHNMNKHGDCAAEVESDTDEGPVNRLSRYIIDPNTMKIDPDSELVLFETPPLFWASHNSGDIAFGKDGMLYITVGDAGTRVKENDDGVTMPQALDRLVGKIVRLTDDGGIPADNPYTGSDSTRCNKNGLSGNPKIKCQEIYATGLRNPYRFAFNPNVDHTHFYINEVGRNMWERILEGGDDHKGANYGFPFRQGPCDTGKTEGKTCQPSEFDDAIHWYAHDEEDGGACTGGAFYPNDAGWPAEFQDGYFFAEYAYGGIYLISPGGEGCAYPKCDPPISPFTPTKKTFSATKKVVSIQFGPHKGGQAMYYMTRDHAGNKGNAGLFRIAYTGSSNRNPKAFIEADNTVGFAPLTVSFDGTQSYDPDGDRITYEWDFDDDGRVDSTEAKPSFTFTEAGTFSAKLVVKDGKGGSAKTTIRIDADNTPPRPTIISPRNGDTFAVGDVFRLVGEAFDGEDGKLDDSALTWEVRQHHNTHYHPFLDPGTAGNNFDLWPAPEPEDFDASLTSYLAIRLTATDSKGLSTTTEVIVQPKVVEIDFDTVPSGMEIVVNGDEFITPTTITTWENHKFDIEAPVQEMNGVNYRLESWSDGGDERHTIIVPATKPKTFIGKFDVAKPKPVILSPKASDTFSVGDVFQLTGSATDEDGNPIDDDSTLKWEVKFNDGNHMEHHDFLDETSGNNIVTDPVHMPEDIATAATAYFEVFLTMTDSSGLSRTSSVIVRPKLVALDLDTVPSGLELTVDGIDIQTPTTISTWYNHRFNIRAKGQTFGGTAYKWASWSNGEKRSQRYMAQTDDKLVAEFKMAMPVPVIAGVKDIQESPEFTVGDEFRLSGSASDIQGDTISAGALSWELRMYNRADDTYRTITTQKGRDFAFVAPEPSFEEAATSHLEVLLTATDPDGITGTQTYVLKPKLSEVVVDTIPSGLVVLADGVQLKTPATITSWQGDTIKLQAPAQRRKNEVFAWHGWSDGSATPTTVYKVPRARKNGKPRNIVAAFGDPSLAPKVSSSSGSISGGALVGLIIGIMVLVGVFAAGFIVLRKKKRSGMVDRSDSSVISDPFKGVDLNRISQGSHSDTHDDSHDDPEGASSIAPSAIPSMTPSSVSPPSENGFFLPTPISISKYLLSANDQRDAEDESIGVPVEEDASCPFSPSYTTSPTPKHKSSTNPFDDASLAPEFTSDDESNADEWR